jgi:hypothetical protein
LGIATVRSASLRVAIRTAHLTWDWRVTQSGADTIGFHTYHPVCHYYRNAIQSGDALIDCNSRGVGALYWNVPLRSDYAIGRYHYTANWTYFFRSENNSLQGQFAHATGHPRFLIEQIGQTHSWLEIVKVVTKFHLTTTI